MEKLSSLRVEFYVKMYDKKKLDINYRRACKSNNKKVVFFLQKLFEEAIERLDIKKSKKFRILELYARNTILEDILKKFKFSYDIYQSIYTSKFNLNDNNAFVHDSRLSKFKDSKFDYCISIFPLASETDILNDLESTHRILSDEEKFIFLFFSEDSCINLKKLFYKFSNLKKENSFLPCFEIISLGNFANSKGFKNVVVDKSKYIISNNKVNEIWKFIRDIGQSNYLLNRNRKNIKRSGYNSLCKSLESLLYRNGKILNEISITFLIGTKKN